MTAIPKVGDDVTAEILTIFLVGCRWFARSPVGSDGAGADPLPVHGGNCVLGLLKTDSIEGDNLISNIHKKSSSF